MDRKAVFGWFARSSRPSNQSPKARGNDQHRILAIVPDGPFRRVLQSVSAQAGWALEVRSCVDSIDPCSVPSIVIYDREVSPNQWPDVIRNFMKESPRPYVILLSSNVDNSLWDELQRAGGSDILRIPATPDRLVAALSAGWQLWSAQRRWHEPLRDNTLAHRVKD